MSNFKFGTWRVALGDPTFVSISNVVKPINCGNRIRAAAIAQVPAMIETLVAILTAAQESSGGKLQRPRDAIQTGRALMDAIDRVPEILAALRAGGAL